MWWHCARLCACPVCCCSMCHIADLGDGRRVGHASEQCTHPHAPTHTSHAHTPRWGCTEGHDIRRMFCRARPCGGAAVTPPGRVRPPDTARNMVIEVLEVPSGFTLWLLIRGSRTNSLQKHIGLPLV
eukprot:5787964-Prymnesium_polylepis.1